MNATKTEAETEAATKPNITEVKTEDITEKTKLTVDVVEFNSSNLVLMWIALVIVFVIVAVCSFVQLIIFKKKSDTTEQVDSNSDLEKGSSSGSGTDRGSNQAEVFDIPVSRSSKTDSDSSDSNKQKSDIGDKQCITEDGDKQCITEDGDKQCITEVDDKSESIRIDLKGIE